MLTSSFSLYILGILIDAYSLIPKYWVNVYFQLSSVYLPNFQLEITTSPTKPAPFTAFLNSDSRIIVPSVTHD